MTVTFAGVMISANQGVGSRQSFVSEGFSPSLQVGNGDRKWQLAHINSGSGEAARVSRGRVSALL
jgi:hypothetical protein